MANTTKESKQLSIVKVIGITAAATFVTTLVALGALAFVTKTGQVVVFSVMHTSVVTESMNSYNDYVNSYQGKE